MPAASPGTQTAPIIVDAQHVDVALRDGSTVRVRPVCPEDAGALRDFLSGMSADARWLRFFTLGVDLDRAARWAAEPGAGAGFGLVATSGSPARIVGHAAYARESEGRAEIAFEVADDWQGRGIATILLGHLASAAEREGILTFRATVHPSNHRMVRVFRDSGFAVEVMSRPGELSIELPASLDEEALARFEDRSRIAAVAAVSHVLRPDSVAVIGASRRSGSVGNAVLRNLTEAGYSGALHVVHPRASSVAGVPAYPSVAAVPGPLELGVVAVPAAAVVDVARECGEAGVRALVVLSAGFAEVGDAGRRRQADLLEVCRASGMRLVGPNCLGVLNTDPELRLNATFAPDQPSPGRVAFASQSGAYGIAAIAEAARRGLGLSSFVSTGDKADLSGNDFLQFWEQDPASDAVLLYLESFGNPRRFGQIARAVGTSKPVVAVKSGRSAAGVRAASSHTGALLAASDVTVDALFEHAGVIRTETVGEMFDVAALLGSQPLPAGNRVAIVTNAGGPGIACADACAAAGLEVAPLGEATRRWLTGRLPREAAVGNPVDMIASASAEDYARVIEALGEDEAVDAIISIFIPPLVTRAGDVAGAVRAAAARTAAAGTPLVAVFMAESDRRLAEFAHGAALPVYATPEEAARALGHTARYAAWRSRGPDEVPDLDAVDSDAAAAIIARALGRGGGWLEPDEVDAVLASYGIPLVESRFAETAVEAARHASELGGPVAIKAIAAGLVHKSDAGGVELGVRSAAAEGAARRVAGAVRAAGHEPAGFLVQRMAPGGVELIAGVVGDPDFGPVVAVGAGGRAVELLGDVTVRLAPIGPRDAGEMLRSLRTFPLLEGYRGAPPADLAAVRDVLMRISALAAAHPEIAELDCNPLLAAPDGAMVLDARLRVEQPRPARPFPALDR